MTETLAVFYHDFREQILMASESSIAGWTMEDFLTSIMLEYLQDAGEIDDSVLCPFRANAMQMNAYVISEDYDNLDIIVSLYSDSETPRTVSGNDVNALFKRGVQLFRRAYNDLYTAFNKDNDTYAFAISIHENRNRLQKVRILALTNGLVKPVQFDDLLIEGLRVSFSVWDIERLFRCMTSGKQREAIEIDFLKKFGKCIPCLRSANSGYYNAYLAIMEGSMLADLYGEYGARLLERNVRSFLQARGGVNKGIRDTLRKEPDMFLAYNNGISVTAESVELTVDENNMPAIRSIRDMQIVNGGQTTASLYTARKEKKSEVDLSQVFVQMKLSVISTPEKMDEIVPRISSCANTQNKIQTADFSANDPYHRKLEELSRTVWTPSVGGSVPLNWFYERARGQFNDALARESTALRKKQFRETHPYFTKTDIAKYECSWAQLPWQVSQGAQKNFVKFTLQLAESGNAKPDQKYYERLIAKAILFRETEKIVQEQKFGGYKANIITYTIAFLSGHTSQRIDLERIWREQGLSPALKEEIRTVSALVHQKIIDPPDGKNITEWCKTKACWESINTIPHQLSEKFSSELIAIGAATSSNKSGYLDSLPPSDEQQGLIDEAFSISANTWLTLSSWAKQTGNFMPWQRSIIFSVGTLVGRNLKPSWKQANQAMRVYREAIDKGFLA